MVKFVKLYRVILTFESVDAIWPKGIEQYFSVALFTLLYEVILTFQSAEFGT